MGQHGFLRSEYSDLEETRVNIGFWLSLVEHSLGVRGVGSSNLPVPTNLKSSSYAVSTPVANLNPSNHLAIGLCLQTACLPKERRSMVFIADPGKIGSEKDPP